MKPAMTLARAILAGLGLMILTMAGYVLWLAGAPGLLLLGTIASAMLVTWAVSTVMDGTS